MGVPYCTAVPVPVEDFRLASVNNNESAIFEVNYGTTITNNPAYSPGMIIFTTEKMRYNVPMSNVEGVVYFFG